MRKLRQNFVKMKQITLYHMVFHLYKQDLWTLETELYFSQMKVDAHLIKVGPFIWVTLLDMLIIVRPNLPVNCHIIQSRIIHLSPTWNPPKFCNENKRKLFVYNWDKDEKRGEETFEEGHASLVGIDENQFLWFSQLGTHHHQH